MVFFEISLNSQKNTFFTEHLHTTAYGFILINFSFQGNFTGQKISSNTLMLRIQYMSVRFSFVTHSIYVRSFFFCCAFNICPFVFLLLRIQYMSVRFSFV